MNYENTRVTTIIAKTGNYLNEPIPGSKEAIHAHVRGLERLGFELLEVRVDWQMLLDEKKAQNLHPKDAHLTEMDRKVDLNARIANIERDVSFLKGLETLVAQRIDIARSLY